MKQKNKFKETEIGLIPKDWEVVELEKVAEIIDCLHSKKPEKTNEGFVYLEVFNLDSKTASIKSDNFTYITKEDYEFWIKRSKPEYGDLVITNTGIVATAMIPENFDCCIGRNMTLIKINKEKVHPEYLRFYSLSRLFKQEMKKFTLSGTILESLHVKFMGKLKIALPPYKEQEIIVKNIKSFFEKDFVNYEMNKTLEAIGKAIFKRWFIDFEFPNEKGKPYKSSGGEMVDTELGKIPKGWKVSKLEDYGIFKNGVNYIRSETGDTDFFIANVRDIANNKLLLKCSLDNIKLNKKKAQAYLLKDKDILIARSASPGEVSLVLGNLDKVIYSGFSIRYRLNNPNNYLYIFLILQGLKENLSNFAVGTTLQSVNQETLKNMKFILPSDKVLHEFSKVVGLIFSRAYNNLIQSQNLSQIRDSLLSRLVSGKIRVPVEVRA